MIMAAARLKLQVAQSAPRILKITQNETVKKIGNFAELVVY